jgi:hypothetical protein
MTDDDFRRDKDAKAWKPSTMSKMIALAIACVTGTLLFSWATAPHVWWSVVCMILMIVSSMYLALASESD